jgi:hypothetical protein
MQLDPCVFEGRNPWWKEAWGERLTAAQRREVRRLGIALPFYAALMGLWLYLACFDGSVSSCTFWSVLAGGWVLAVPIALIVRLRQLRRAERANTWGGSSDG